MAYEFEVSKEEKERFLRLGDEIHFPGFRKRRIEERQAAFAENSRAGDELSRLVREMLRDPPKHDRYGKPFNRDITYGEALQLVMQDHPDLAEKYTELLDTVRILNSVPFSKRGGE